MNDLIKVSDINNPFPVNARDLHKSLEVGTRFNDWITRQIEKYGFIESKDFYSTMSKTNSETGGRPSKDYLLSLPTAKELCMVENNEAGRRVRRYLIKVEEAWNTPALIMARALQVANAQITGFQQQIKKLSIKADFYDQVAGSADAIEMREVAAVLNRNGWGRNKVFELLRKLKVLDDENLPYRRYQDAGYFRVIEQKFTDATGETKISLKTLVYQRGIAFIGRLLRQHENTLPFDEEKSALESVKI